MILIDTNRLAVILALVLTALMVPALHGFEADAAFWPAMWSEWIIPFVLIAEISIFTVILSSQRQVRSLTPAFIGALMLVAVRAACCLAGAALMPLLAGDSFEGFDVLFVDGWVGAPLTLALQELLLIAVLPAMLRLWAPGFLDQSMLARMQRSSQQGMPVMPAPTSTTAQVIDATELRIESAGGSHVSPFIYSFDDLSRQLDRMVGLEGHLVISDEGLLISGRVTREDDADLAGQLSGWLAASEPLLAAGDRMPRHSLIHTSDHWVAAMPLPEGASLHLFFIERLSASQVAQTAARAAEAARSLFSYRYGDQTHAETRALGATSL